MFQSGPVTDYATALRSDTKAYSAFFHAMLNRGIYLPPAQYEAMFVSLAHTDEQIDQTIVAAEESFAWVRTLIESIRHRGLDSITEIVRRGEGTDSVRLVRELLGGRASTGPR